MESFFSLYASLSPLLSSIALSSLVQIVLVRRSLFNNTERAKFLNELVTGVRNILENPQQMWQFAPNSVHYLLSLWQKMVVMPYVKANEPNLLETYNARICCSVSLIAFQASLCLFKLLFRELQVHIAVDVGKWYFNKLRDSIIASQPPDKQQAMVQCFENLMSGIERSLHTKNRDKFTQNLSLFRRDVNDSLKAANGQSPTHLTQFLDMMS